MFPRARKRRQNRASILLFRFQSRLDHQQENVWYFWTEQRSVFLGPCQNRSYEMAQLYTIFCVFENTVRNLPVPERQTYRKARKIDTRTEVWIQVKSILLWSRRRPSLAWDLLYLYRRPLVGGSQNCFNMTLWSILCCFASIIIHGSFFPQASVTFPSCIEAGMLATTVLVPAVFLVEIMSLTRRA